MSKYNRDRGLSGLNPLSYLGVEPSTPPQLLQELRRPTPNDYIGYDVGTIWLVKDTEEIWMLVGKDAQVANWTLTTSGDLSFLADDGDSANPEVGVVNIAGGSNIETHVVNPGSNRFFVKLKDNIVIPGTIQLTSLANGFLSTDGTGLISASTGTNGQVLIGGGINPLWKNLTPGAGIAITDGVNSITITNTNPGGGVGGGYAGLIDDLGVTAPQDGAFKTTVAGGVGLRTWAAGTTLTVDFEESPLNGDIIIGGGAGTPCAWGSITSTGGSIAVTHPAPNTINLESVGAGSIGALTADDANDASPLAAKVTIAGGVLINTTAAIANTLTVNLDYPAANGQVLISSAAGIPAWANIISSDASINITRGANTMDLVAVGGGGAGFAGMVADDTNTAIPDGAHKINVIGDVGISTTAAVANTLKIGIGSSTSNGQLLIGGGAGNPSAWGLIESSGGTIARTYPGANRINLEVDPLNVFAGLKDDASAIAGPDAAHTVKVAGVAGRTKTTTSPNTVTVDLDYPAVDGQVLISSAAGVPVWASLTAGADITILPAANAITITNSGGGGGGGGINQLDVNNGTPAVPDVATPTTLAVLGDEDAGSSGYANITTYARVWPGPSHDVVEVTLKPAVALPATTAWNSGIIYMGGRAVAGGANRMMHRYGTYNTFYGLDSGNLTLTANASRNTGIGYNALNALVGTNANEGTQNTAVGNTALKDCTSGSYNTAIGADSMDSLTSGTYNTAIGKNALTAATTASFCTAVGADTLASAILAGASPNTAVGYAALNKLTTGVANTAIGYQAMSTNVSGDYNTAVGQGALLTNTDDYNTAVGYNALNLATTSTGNTAIGYRALASAPLGDYNTAVGNAAIGGGTLTGAADHNIGMGYRPLYSLTSGKENISIGHNSMYSNTIGTFNVAIGGITADLPSQNAALQASINGDRNTAIGCGALGNAIDPYHNIAIGYKAGSSLTGAEGNNILIGSGGVAGESSVTRIVSGGNATYINGIYNKADGTAPRVVMCGSDGKLSTSSSGYNSPYAPGGVVLVARMTADISNVTGDLTKYYLGEPLRRLSMSVNRGGGTYVDGGTGVPATYTVPVSGVYLITFNCRLNGLRIAVAPAPPPAPPPVYYVDPVCIETSAHGDFSYFPTLTWNGYQPFTSSAISAMSYLNAGETVRWYIQIDYRPGDLGDYSPTGMRKEIGIDGYDGATNYYTFVGLTLLNAY